MRNVGVLLAASVLFCFFKSAFVTRKAAFVFDCVGGVSGQTSVESYVATESPIAKSGLLANIGPDGSKSSGAKVRWPRLLSTFGSV